MRRLGTKEPSNTRKLPKDKNKYHLIAPVLWCSIPDGVVTGFFATIYCISNNRRKTPSEGEVFPRNSWRWIRVAKRDNISNLNAGYGISKMTASCEADCYLEIPHWWNQYSQSDQDRSLVQIEITDNRGILPASMASTSSKLLSRLSKNSRSYRPISLSRISARYPFVH